MALIQPMTQDDILKLKAVALYVINKCKSIDFIHLFKIIYFADRKHYATYGRRIVKDTFCAMQNGPVPSNLYNAVKIARGKEELSGKLMSLKTISDAIVISDPSADYVISAKELADREELSLSDIKMLDESINENIRLTFDEVSEKSHDKAWNVANTKHQNSEMDPHLIAESGGASEEMMDFIKEIEVCFAN
ncbi:hypothetical protein HMPREF3027_06735 [Porphyromonas sp. HMSC077F02]|uniref:Panacea domain-containing protein n=1 Tax=Porphyromonas sp. HMSC077F02 TaxID=1739529 RepID=UPI0008AD9742|nr:Panacea domain-containing protein [Porphyromonas sp. HMSC077F02]OFO52345.1 hypothetical protein HMPREF3027_06735 [Porphyromonas sp. HMSC077F02]